uniref:Uncharacterized protein n=1 Tax=Meloidogyne hapla TaxID=6305 RepID=A0A1I8B0V4_MELHA
MRQTIRHFNALFIEYENELARTQCKKLYIFNKQLFDKYFGNLNVPCEEIEPRLETLDIKLKGDLMMKWQSLIGRKLCLNKCLNQVYVVIKDNSMTQNVFFKIPTSPKNIKQLLFIRYWLERLFNYVFEEAKFNKIMFSHRFIKLLFFDYTNPLQFKIKNAFFKYYKPTEGMKFVLHNLAICESFNLRFTYVETEYNINDEANPDYNSILNIILNEGKRFPNISVNYTQVHEWHDVILKTIETSRNYSNILSNIDFKVHWEHSSLRFKRFSKKAKNIQKLKRTYLGELHKVIQYELRNIHNPKVKFLISYWDCIDEEYIDRFQIKRIK